MKVTLTFFSLVISTFLFAQNNTGKQTNATGTFSAASANEKNNGKKVHYVEKRTKPVQPNSGSASGLHEQKKSVIRKAENQNKVSSK